MKVGDRVRSEPWTLAHRSGDYGGVIIEKNGDDAFLVRMDQSQKSVWFHADQIIPDPGRIVPPHGSGPDNQC